MGESTNPATTAFNVKWTSAWVALSDDERANFEAMAQGDWADGEGSAGRAGAGGEDDDECQVGSWRNGHAGVG